MSEKKCNCENKVEGVFICWKCGKPTGFPFDAPEDKTYSEYLRLCEVYGEQIARTMVYG